VVAGGKVFHLDGIEGKETLHALDPSTGRELWRATVDDSFQDEQGPSGPRCTPLVDGEFIYAQSCRGELQCRAVREGRLVWRANFRKDFGAVLLGEDSKVPGAAEHGYTASPLVVGEQLIACAGGTNGAGIVSFDKRAGTVLWRSQSDLASYAAPILATLGGAEQVVCFTVEGVIGLSPNEGRLLWRVPLKTSYGRNVTTPVAMRDWVIVGSYQAGLVGIEVTAENGSFKAAKRWTNKAAAMNFSSPVAMGGHVYGLGPARNLICVEIASGKMEWSKDGFWATAADAAYGAFVLWDPYLLVSTDTGTLILAAATPAGCRELNRTQVCGKNWCSPAVAGRRAFLRDGMGSSGKLYCVELTEPREPGR
jgi:outer membrane protein assembly factor BamB